MKKNIHLLTIVLIFLANITIAQDIWYEHWVIPYGNHMPNINSVSINNSPFWGLACGDSGYIALWQNGVGDYWSHNNNFITNKNLFSIFDIDSSYIIKAYIVGQSGKIFKTNSVPFSGDIPFYNQNSPTTRNLFNILVVFSLVLSFG